MLPRGLSPAASHTQTPFLLSVQNKNAAIMKLLAEAEADFKKDIQGKNAIHLAAHNGDVEIIQAFMEIAESRGVDIKEYIDAKTERGYTPLLAAITYAKGDDTSIVRLLVKLGADIRHGADGWTNSIHCAARFGKPEIIKILVEAAGNDANFIGERDARGKTPLSLAAQNNQIEAIRTLLSLDTDGAVALLEAAHLAHWGQSRR